MKPDIRSNSSLACIRSSLPFFYLGISLRNDKIINRGAVSPKDFGSYEKIRSRTKSLLKRLLSSIIPSQDREASEYVSPLSISSEDFEIDLKRRDFTIFTHPRTQDRGQCHSNFFRLVLPMRTVIDNNGFLGSNYFKKVPERLTRDYISKRFPGYSSRHQEILDKYCIVARVDNVYLFSESRICEFIGRSITECSGFDIVEESSVSLYDSNFTFQSSGSSWIVENQTDLDEWFMRNQDYSSPGSISRDEHSKLHFLEGRYYSSKSLSSYSDCESPQKLLDLWDSNTSGAIPIIYTGSHVLDSEPEPTFSSIAYLLCPKHVKFLPDGTPEMVTMPCRQTVEFSLSLEFHNSVLESPDNFRKSLLDIFDSVNSCPGEGVSYSFRN